MTDVRVRGEKTRDSLRVLSAGIHQAAGLALRSAVDAAEKSAKSTTLFQDRRPVNNNSPGDVGTRGSIHGEIFGLRGTLIARGAAHFLENGTPPHTIVAHGKALRFVVNGQTIFRRWVRHPGTAERPFMSEAAKAGEQALEYGADFFVGEAIRRAH